MVSYELQPGGRLWLRYYVECELEKLELPAPSDPVRTDGLWNSTCFELFVRGDGDAYFEFNFAPSSRWAAYRFAAYRNGAEDWLTDAPEIYDDASESSFAVEVALRLPNGASEIGLSAIVHEVGGVKSYWAVRHPPGEPDFHHRDCFALKLSPPERA